MKKTNFLYRLWKSENFRACISAFLILNLFSSFSFCPCHPPKFHAPCCPDMRRPPVIYGEEPCILDFNSTLEDVEFCEEFCELAEDCCHKGNHNPPFKHEPYRLAIGDILEISIFGDEDTSVENVVVATDGRIYYAFLDGIEAVGKTILELGEEMSNSPKLKELYVKPMVSITLREAINRTFSIMGRVNLPGVFPILQPITLRDAIGQAGGILKNTYEDSYRRNDLTSLADLSRSYVMRNGEKLNVNFEEVMYSASSKNDIRILPGDFIYIAPTDLRQVFILGAIAAPKAIGWEDGITLMHVMASAGGWVYGSPFGPDLTRIVILRGNLDCPCVIRADVMLILRGQARDVYLQPGDVVYVCDKTMRFGRQLVTLIINTFVQAFATSAGNYWGTRWFPNPRIRTTTTGGVTTTTGTTGTIVTP